MVISHMLCGWLSVAVVYDSGMCDILYREWSDSTARYKHCASF